MSNIFRFTHKIFLVVFFPNNRLSQRNYNREKKLYFLSALKMSNSIDNYCIFVCVCSVKLQKVQFTISVLDVFLRRKTCLSMNLKCAGILLRKKSIIKYISLPNKKIHLIKHNLLFFISNTDCNLKMYSICEYIPQSTKGKEIFCT